MKVNGAVSGDWSLSSSEELEEEDPTVLSFYVYGEHGLYWEYFIDQVRDKPRRSGRGRIARTA